MSQNTPSTAGSFWPGIGKFVGIVVGIVVLLVGAAGLSFLRWGPFSLVAYSERVFWAGMGAMVLGGFAVFASMGAVQMYGIPSVFTAGADSRNFMDRFADVQRTVLARYRFSFVMFLVGMACVGVSALLEILSR